MNIKVLYHTRTGNTKTVAEAIANSFGAVPESISKESRLSGVDLLFIGDGLYGGTIDKTTKEFIKSLSPTDIRTAAVFSTFGGQNKANGVLKSLLQEQGIPVQEEAFSCKGKAWWILNRNHPNSKELHLAKEFGKRQVEECRK
jgi:flavodoxin